MGENAPGFTYPVKAGYCVCGHNGDIAGRLRATETNVSENLYQEGYLIPAYPKSLQGSQAVLTLVSLAYHKVSYKAHCSLRLTENSSKWLLIFPV